MHKQAKLRSYYRKCAACGGSGTAPAAVNHQLQLPGTGPSEADGGASALSRHTFKPLYRPIDDPNAADPFVEDPFSGFVPLRWKEVRDRQPNASDTDASRGSGDEEELIYNACYLGRGNDHRIWFELDESSGHEPDSSQCWECDGKGVIRVEWKVELSLAPALVLLGIASCAAVYTERPLLTTAVYGAALLAARIVRFKSERYFVQDGAELFAANRKTGLATAHHECKCELADSY